MPWTKYFDSTGVARAAFVRDGQMLLTDEEDLLVAIDTGLDGLTQVGAVPIDEVELAPLVIDPPSIRDFMAFEAHVLTTQSARGLPPIARDWYDTPAFYFTNPAAAMGPREDVAIPPGTNQFDFELEVAIVVGREGRDIPIEYAEDHIAGLLLLCDWSSRDIQMREMQQGLGPSKGKDSATSFGHLLVPISELEPLRKDKAFDIGLRASVNGKSYSDGNLSTVYWSFSEMLAHASVGTRVRRGDILGTGTVATGCIFELSAVHGEEQFPYLKPGDTVDLDGGLLGSIRTTILPSSGGNQIFPRKA